MWPFPRKSGTAPEGFSTIALTPSPVAQYYYQEKQTYPWPSAVPHQTRAALTNAWNGNQLPGATNFIKGVPSSRFVWNVPTSYPNTLKNQQYNKGYNIQGMGAWNTGLLQTQVYQAWQNRTGYSG